MAEPAPHPRPRYRVVCYELIGEREELIMDVTDQGFVVATGGITATVMEGELCHAGPHKLQAHLALLIANDKQLLGDHTRRQRRPR
jgi:hypothetical protein